MIRIYDGNNYYRRLIEANPTGLTAREVLTDTFNCPDVQIWVWDGANGNAKRRELFPDYKSHRQPVRTDIYVGFDTVKSILAWTPAFQIEVPGYEGDDVIATLAQRYAAGGNEVAIYSTDFDFIQLTGRYPSHIFCGAKLKDHVSGDLVRHYKCWVGDPSDNIRGIPGFGEVTWQRTDKDVIKRVTSEIIAGEQPTVFESRLSKKVNDWLADPANQKQFRIYWDIVGFYEVPDILLDKHLICGESNYEAADNYLKEFFL